MYSVHGYAAMIHDARRIRAYRQAIESAVKPGSVVIDIGTGLGIFAFLACQAGARKVYAIEPADVIAVASEIAASNGFADRIEFIQDLSTQVKTEELADVIVSDMGGSIPLFRHHLPSIVDARERLLKPGGRMIPRSDTLWAGVVSAAAVHAKLAPSTGEEFGLDLSAGWRLSTNLLFNTRFAASQLLTPPAELVTIDYATVAQPDVQARAAWEIPRGGEGHGLSLWFSRTLADGVCYSTAPGEPEMAYGGVFCPWPTAVRLESGDRVTMEIRADLRKSDYVWTWNTTIARGEQQLAKFRQSTFFGEPRAAGGLRKESSTYVPRLTEDGERDCFVLAQMDGTRPVEAIAHAVMERFAGRFQTLEQALGYVAGLSNHYSR